MVKRQSTYRVCFAACLLSVAFMVSFDSGTATPLVGQGAPISIVIQQTASAPMTQAGTALTYTLSVSASITESTALVITDTLSSQVHTDEALAGTVLLPGNRLVWQVVMTASEPQWHHSFVVTVTEGYAGPLVNHVEVTMGDATQTSVLSTRAVLTLTRQFLPLTLYKDPRPLYGNLLVNPGFEGIGVSVDNSQRNDGNWTRDTFDGQAYGEIFTPEGWVTWWEEGDYKRPECRVIPNEAPFDVQERIYQGYYAGMCFTFWGRQHAGYYQVVDELPPGTVVESWFYAHAWSCDMDSPPLSCSLDENFAFSVGLDPTGATDPFGSTVIWSAPYHIYDVYEQVGPMQVTVGESGKVTFYLRAHSEEAYKHNHAYWDNPTLIIKEP